MSERRALVRRETNDYFVAYKENSNEIIGRVLNLTPEGAMMISDDPIKVPSIHLCEMRLPDVIVGCRFLSFRVESCWCTQHERFEWYETGYKFIEISSNAKSIIKHIIGDWQIKQDQMPLTVKVTK